MPEMTPEVGKGIQQVGYIIQRLIAGYTILNHNYQSIEN
jgi:hypothetical protein